MKEKGGESQIERKEKKRKEKKKKKKRISNKILPRGFPGTRRRDRIRSSTWRPLPAGLLPHWGERRGSRRVPATWQLATS